MVDGAHGPAQAVKPRDPRLVEGWRAAAAAYRRVYGEWEIRSRGPANEAMTAAVEALHDVLPDLTQHEAMLEAIQAVSYASREHPQWLYELYRPLPRR